jgi:trans-aconitate 2-methyltransferase
MNQNPEKDFGLIADDYSFFETHATEAEQDARAYLEQLGEIVPRDGVVRMLDFGCGSGTFTERVLKLAGWPPEQLRLTLVEPVDAVRRQAVARLAGFTASQVEESAKLAKGVIGAFDLILANHVFYYVPQLEDELAKLMGALAATGVFITAIAGRSNVLIQFWIAGFHLLGREIPYHTSEDVEIALKRLGANHRKQDVEYELTFEDTEENRMRILRFLLAEHLGEMPPRPLLDLFDSYSDGGRIQIRTSSDHYTISRRS